MPATCTCGHTPGHHRGGWQCIWCNCWQIRTDDAPGAHHEELATARRNGDRPERHQAWDDYVPEPEWKD